MGQLDWNKYYRNGMKNGGQVKTSYPREKEALELAKSGRYGDTMIMHVNPAEVDYLRQAGIVTTNPETGQPEAFIGALLGGIVSLLTSGVGAIGGLISSGLAAAGSGIAAAGSGIAGLFGAGGAAGAGAAGTGATAGTAAATAAAEAAAAAGATTAGTAGTTAAQLAAAEAAKAAAAKAAAAEAAKAAALNSSGNFMNLFAAKPAGLGVVRPELLATQQGGAGGFASMFPGGSFAPGTGMVHPSLLSQGITSPGMSAASPGFNTSSMVAQGYGPSSQLTSAQYTALQNAKAAQAGVVNPASANTSALSSGSPQAKSITDVMYSTRGTPSPTNLTSTGVGPKPPGYGLAPKVPTSPPPTAEPTTVFSEAYAANNPAYATNAELLEGTARNVAGDSLYSFPKTTLPENLGQGLSASEFASKNWLPLGIGTYGLMSTVLGGEEEEEEREPYVNMYDEKGLVYSPSWRENQTAAANRARAVGPGAYRAYKRRRNV